MIDIYTYEKRKKIWMDSLILPGFNSFKESATAELAEFFSKSTEDIARILIKSKEMFAKEWHTMKVDVANEDEVIKFYNSSYAEIFELMDWHVNRFTTDYSMAGPLNYVCALEIAMKFRFKEYLDFGSGIGSGAILFQKNGFNVTCADISNPLLQFAQWRFKNRNLSANFIRLKHEKFKKSNYDIITCFDVLEHSVNPLIIIKELRAALKKGGLLLLNNTECKKNEVNPMHISAVNLENKMRSLGFIQLWDLQKEFKKSSETYVIILKKIQNPFLTFLFYVYDTIIPRSAKKIIKSLMRTSCV